jgi:hypothetical protein
MCEYEKGQYEPNPEAAKIGTHESISLDWDAYEALYYRERNEVPPKERQNDT